MVQERININPTSGVSRLSGTSLTETLTGARTITLAELDTYHTFRFDPGGAARTVTLPAEAASKGALIFIVNTADAAEVITVQDDGTNTIGTPTQNEAIILTCDGTTWDGIVGARS